MRLISKGNRKAEIVIFVNGRWQTRHLLHKSGVWMDKLGEVYEI